MNWITLLILASLAANAQQDSLPNYPLPDFPKGDFIMPMKVPMDLSGNFGETRKSHFHMGLDIKTNEREGEPVFAIGDGYVSRIGVSPYGYGNALYITHPNGYTSVYGHLKEFNANITALLRAEQQRSETFAVDINLTPEKLVVKKGEQIALSGNTGGSGGPHLHFEIRDAQERPINPLLFGYKVNDHVPPLVNALQLYSLDEAIYPKAEKRLSLKNMGGTFSPSESTLLVNASKIGVAVNTFDKMTNSTNSFGIYSILLKQDSVPIFEYKNDRHSFDEKRMIIAHLDYETFLTQGFRAFHKCFKETGNLLSAYPSMVNNGTIDISDGKEHLIEIEIADFNENISRVSFRVQQSLSATFFPKAEMEYTTFLRKDSINKWENELLKLVIPPSCLIDPMPLKISFSAPTLPTAISPTVQLNKSSLHLLDNYQLWLKAPVSKEDEGKVVMIWKDEKGRVVTKKADYKNGYVVFKPREFGAFYASLDNTNPTIRPVSFNPLKSMGNYKRWIFSIADSGAGIDTYKVFIDNKWLLAEYDAKYNSLAVINEAKLAAGQHSIKIIVSDVCGNKAIYQTNFIY